MATSHIDHLNILHLELDRFQRLFSQLKEKFGGRKLNEHIYQLGSPNKDESYDLTLSCLIHGNELGGLRAINLFLGYIQNSGEGIEKSLCIIMGNLKAAELNKRFYARDLNRCFGSLNTNSYEEILAKLIEPHLNHTRVLVDLHQTNSPTQSDFYIFPCTRENIKFAKNISPSTPIVVHEKDFSQDGMCMDTYVTSIGGVGLTYEMGMIGKDSEQLEKTVALLYEAYLVKIKQKVITATLPPLVFSWSEVILSSPGRELVPGLYNFSQINGGDTLGYDSSGPILVQKSGHVLFPKYGEAALYSSELCRVVCAYRTEELVFSENSQFVAAATQLR